jgi:hypothetical protein
MLFADVGVYKWIINPNGNGILWQKLHAQEDFSLNGISLVPVDQCNGEFLADGPQIFFRS